MSILPENKEIMTLQKARELNPLVLAYVGDGVHTLYVRLLAVHSTTGKADKLHNFVTSRVNAKAQAQCMQKILPLLDEEENGIYHRARNSHQHSMAKNATVADYKSASGFEAVIGFLYLTGNTERLQYLLDCASAE